MDESDIDQADTASDYGSDFTADEERLLTTLLYDTSQDIPDADNPIIRPDLGGEGIENPAAIVQYAARLPLPRSQAPSRSHSLRSSQQDRHETAVDTHSTRHIQIVIDLDHSDSHSKDVAADPAAAASNANANANANANHIHLDQEPSPSIDAPLDPSPESRDHRTPLDRFRTKPRKPLSVTDLISPSWCELQYWFTLTKHGKKRPTPAMRQGSIVHKTLEEQVHTTVAVDVRSREDAWALRFSNVIQGLNTLQETGITRELEVWGIVNGQLVNGVIDELSYVCPDPDLEAALEESKNASSSASTGARKKTERPLLPADQSTITDYLAKSGATILESNSDSQRIEDATTRPGHPVTVRPLSSMETTARVYLTDVKTRHSPSIPRGASFRPTQMQLMIYHRLLTDMAVGNFDPKVLFDRYNLDPYKPFSQTFLAQMGQLSEVAGQEEHDENDDDDDFGAPENPDSNRIIPSLFSTHPNLSALSTLLLSAVRQAFCLKPPIASNPDVSSSEPVPSMHTQSSSSTDYSFHSAPSTATDSTCISPLLTASYLSASSIPIGTHTFVNDPALLSSYLEDTMAWWKGERSARGVELEEAYKCGSCDFADACEWRAKKIEDGVKRFREQKRRSSRV